MKLERSTGGQMRPSEGLMKLERSTGGQIYPCKGPMKMERSTGGQIRPWLVKEDRVEDRRGPLERTAERTVGEDRQRGPPERTTGEDCWRRPPERTTREDRGEPC
ncbi:unnamed protein product [Cuscuta campestris]|uniref:Uncharacterized protein n=1 Tax=Cuscuta campestris TaxID=132261 RepID=A0A484M3C7_9ASTE|nr:unnamed protein product [Cuscuta campestris]